MSEPLDLPDPPLTDGTVTLRPWRDADVPALVAVCRDPEVVRWTKVPSPYTEHDAQTFMLVKQARQARGEEAYFAAVDPPDRRLLGSFSLRPLPARAADVGYFVAAGSRRRGVATRALELIAGWAFESLRVARLQLVTDVDNVASQRTALAAGFRREGVLRSYLEVRDHRSDAAMFSLLPGERRGVS